MARELVNLAAFLLLLGMGIRYTFFTVIHSSEKPDRPFATQSFLLGLFMPLGTPTIAASYVAIAGLLHANGFLLKRRMRAMHLLSGPASGHFCGWRR